MTRPLIAALITVANEQPAVGEYTSKEIKNESERVEKKNVHKSS